ncbi:MAG: metal ABC transporter substrate-binding protein, partial [Acidimicrobiales bacterium]
MSLVRRRLVAVLVAVAALATACGGAGRTEPGKGTGALSVVASFYPVAEAARRVGGDAAAVTNLTPPGVEPHDLELTPVQVDTLEDADLVLYLGRGFQPAIEAVVERRKGPSVDLLADVGAEDPHFWLDPIRMARAVGHVEKAMSAADPDDIAAFRANAERYQTDLRALDSELEAGLAGCRRRVLVTSHAAFHYLADRYGLTQQALSGISPEAEPDPQRLAELTDLIRREGVTTVFYEELVPASLARTLAR